MSLPLLLGGAGILSGLLKSQQYYPAAEAPTRAQIYGDALGGGIGGYIGGSQMGGGDPLGVLGATGIGQKATGGGPRVLNPAGQAAIGQAAGGQGISLLDLLTNGGFSGAGATSGITPTIMALSPYAQPRNPSGYTMGSLI